MGKDELIVIVPAAGAGKRLGLGINKAFAMLNGAPLLVHCLHMFLNMEQMFIKFSLIGIKDIFIPLEQLSLLPII